MHSFILPLILSSLLLPLVQGIVIVYPTASTVYNQSGSTLNLVQWALNPATFPAPATNYFDVYLRNGIGAMYPVPLNVSVGQHLDSTDPAATYIFPSASAFVPGPGYQLFFTAPGEANTVYCDSEVFSIGTTVFNPSSVSYTGPFLPLQTTSVNGVFPTVTGGLTALPSSSPIEVTATLTTTLIITDNSTEGGAVPTAISTQVLTQTVVETSFVTSKIPSATSTSSNSGSGNSNGGGQDGENVGGPAGQGFGLLNSARGEKALGSGLLAALVSISTLVVLFS